MKLLDDSLLDDNLLIEGVDDTEEPGELAEDDKDFLKSLEKKAEEIEIEDEPGNAK
jgi:hypothetical protein